MGSSTNVDDAPEPDRTTDVADRGTAPIADLLVAWQHGTYTLSMLVEATGIDPATWVVMRDHAVGRAIAHAGPILDATTVPCVACRGSGRGRDERARPRMCPACRWRGFLPKDGGVTE